MKIKIPIAESVKFNPEMFAEGTPISIKTPNQEFGVFGIVQNYEPNVLTVAVNKPKGFGHLQYLGIGDVVEEQMELIPINIDEGGMMIMPVQVFNVSGIPVGSLLEDGEGEVSFVVEVDEYAIYLQDANGGKVTLTAEEYFLFDQHEQDAHLLYIPPAISAEWLKEADVYKEFNKALEDAEGLK